MLEREIYTEIPGCKLIPIQREVVTSYLERISADPFSSTEQDVHALNNSNPGLRKLLGEALRFEPNGLIINLYHEGIVKAYRMFIDQAIANGIIIPKISELKSQGLAQGIARKNLGIFNSFENKRFESLYQKVGADLSVEHGHFVDGIREITRYSYYGDSIGLGAFDTFRFMYDFFLGGPIKIWTNLN